MIKIFSNNSKDVFESEVNDYLRDNPNCSFPKQKKRAFTDRWFVIIQDEPDKKGKGIIRQIKCFDGRYNTFDKQINDFVKDKDHDFVWFLPNSDGSVFYAIIVYDAFKRIEA